MSTWPESRRAPLSEWLLALPPYGAVAVDNTDRRFLRAKRPFARIADQFRPFARGLARYRHTTENFVGAFAAALLPQAALVVDPRIDDDACAAVITEKKPETAKGPGSEPMPIFRAKGVARRYCGRPGSAGITSSMSLASAAKTLTLALRRKFFASDLRARQQASARLLNRTTIASEKRSVHPFMTIPEA
jgi:hypothetical protein